MTDADYGQTIWMAEGGKIWIFKNIPMETEDYVEDWYFKNEIAANYGISWNDCEWGTFESLEEVTTPKDGWVNGEEEESEEESEEEGDIPLCAECKKNTASKNEWSELFGEYWTLCNTCYEEDQKCDDGDD